MVFKTSEKKNQQEFVSLQKKILAKAFSQKISWFCSIYNYVFVNIDYFPLDKITSRGRPFNVPIWSSV